MTTRGHVVPAFIGRVSERDSEGGCYQYTVFLHGLRFQFLSPVLPQNFLSDGLLAERDPSFPKLLHHSTAKAN